MPVGRVDHRGTSQTCSSCRYEVRKALSVRLHVCNQCGYVQDRDLVSAQEICNRGIETYRGNSEKQEIGSQVVLSGNLVVDKWRNSSQGVRRAKSVSDNAMPAL
ncbi:MAG: zinc ribbon domain-containing protein [Pleurocapsa sp. MO_192.B19]|nr:zinc ribbon domain-containing protein [Pleurocapsa sp. MO_192.B19]